MLQLVALFLNFSKNKQKHTKNIQNITEFTKLTSDKQTLYSNNFSQLLLIMILSQ
jgi:hypothetical protein